MTDLLAFVFEYRRLLHRRTGRRLPTRSEDRLDALHRLLGCEPDHEDEAIRRAFARCEVQLPALVRSGSMAEPVSVINIGGGGVCVKPAPPLELGDEAALRITSPDSGLVYECLVAARWLDEASGSMGLTFVGPLRELRAAS